MPWREMQGDERERFCAKCSRSVVNLSLLTEPQRVALLANTDPRDLCVAYYRRLSGEEVSAENPLTAEESRRTVQLGITALSLGAAALAFNYAQPASNAMIRAQPDFALQAALIQAQVTHHATELIDKIGESFGRKKPEPVIVLMGAICLPPMAAPTPMPASGGSISP